jgi:hypothetical protein
MQLRGTTKEAHNLEIDLLPSVSISHSLSRKAGQCLASPSLNVILPVRLFRRAAVKAAFLFFAVSSQQSAISNQSALSNNLYAACCSGRAGLQASVQALYFRHSEAATAAEESAVSSFSAACSAVPHASAMEWALALVHRG